MLAAELRKKLGRALSCAVCNQTTSAESYFGFEDVLTSNVFGALRYLDPRYGLHAVLRDVDVGSFTDATIEFWPCRNGCEPDVVIDTPETLIVVETKLRSTFGHNQLPREVLFAHHRAAGRPWRLLCITDETREPRHAAYGPDRTLIAGSALSLGAGVATYFARTNETDLTAEEIARRVVWMPWWRVADRLDESRSTLAPPPAARALLDDLLASLAARGLTRIPFGGFGHISSSELAWARGWMGWKGHKEKVLLAWLIPTMRDSWQATGWMPRPAVRSEPVKHAGAFRGFASAAATAQLRYEGWFTSGGAFHG